jgi:hypothetical protein
MTAMNAFGLLFNARRTAFLHFESAWSVTLQVLMTTTSGVSSMLTRAYPDAAKSLAMVEVSLKFNLHPKV